MCGDYTEMFDNFSTNSTHAEPSIWTDWSCYGESIHMLKSKIFIKAVICKVLPSQGCGLLMNFYSSRI